MISFKKYAFYYLSKYLTQSHTPNKISFFHKFKFEISL